MFEVFLHCYLTPRALQCKICELFYADDLIRLVFTEHRDHHLLRLDITHVLNSTIAPNHRPAHFLVVIQRLKSCTSLNCDVLIYWPDLLISYRWNWWNLALIFRQNVLKFLHINLLSLLLWNFLIVLFIINDVSHLNNMEYEQ